MQSKQYAPGETIIAEGTYGNQTFLIRQGQVLICKETGRKKRIPITVLKEGEVFGEMYLFDDTGFRSATVVAQNEVTVEIILREEMEQYMANTPPIVQSMVKTLSARLAETSQENSLLKFRRSASIVEKIIHLFK